ncbi:MAG: clostripain-related cysteine peptidase [Chloroflexota bacterium]
MRHHWFFLFLLLLLLPACEFRQNVSTLPTAVPAAALPTSTSIALPALTATPPLLPTAPATAVPQPTPTYNPTLADWTILVYMAADNNLETAALQDLNEMEAAGSSEQVNVLVQLDRSANDSSADGDWQETRRYVVQADTDPAVITSTFTIEGEVNMGEAGALNDFLAWGIQTYPANHYALILWDHGAGWNGFAFDNDAGDHLTLPELATAVSQALAQTSLDKLDVVAFDACLMGQLDVFHALQPYADYAVGSAELTPGHGWDYQTLFANLLADSDIDGAQFARQMVDDFGRTYTQAEPDDFVTMTAVSLADLPPLTHAVEQLAAALLHDPQLAASAVADARSGTESFARAYGTDGEQYAAIDLGHFAAILSQRSPDPTVQEMAVTLQQALATATIAHMHGSGFKHSQGVAIYFPRQQEFYTPEYGRITQLTTWNRFLHSYYDVGLAALPAPEVNLVSNLRDTVSVANPAYLEFEIVGREIDEVRLIGGRYEADGQRRLLEYDNLIPEPTYLPDGSQLYEWRDGLHEDFFIWDTQVTYLYDSFDNGGFVVMWPTDPGSTLFTVPGQFRRAAASVYQPASLVFDHRQGELVRIWGSSTGDDVTAVAEIMPQPGDEFQVDEFYLDGNDNIVQQAGGSLFFDENGRLYFDWRPLSDGSYFLGFAASNSAGDEARTFTDLTIANADAVPGWQAYLDPYLGFQFLYPNEWYTPVYSGTLLYSSNDSGSTHLQITAYPNLNRDVTPQTLKDEALFRFGAVDILFAEEIAVAEMRGLRTAYGYDDANGAPHTGIFFTFVHDKTGFVVDIDGLEADEAETVTAVTNLITSWQFSGASFGLQPGQWASFNATAFTIPKPTDFIYQPFNAWQRFSADRDTFVALRAQPATRPISEVLEALVRDAGRDVAGFTVQTPRQFALGSTLWQRADFSYTVDGKEIWGFIMVRIENGQEIVAWAEAPKSTYNDLEPRVFLIMIADLILN